MYLTDRGSEFGNPVALETGINGVKRINSYAREKLNGAAPYKASLKKFGPDTLRALQLNPVASDLVTLAPTLLK